MKLIFLHYLNKWVKEKLAFKIIIMVKIINSEQELEKEHQASNSKITVLDFYADWCGPCKMLTPVFEELSNKYKDRINIFKVNVDEAEKLCQEHDISCMPTIVFIVNNKVIESLRIEGYNKEQLNLNIESCFKLLESDDNDSVNKKKLFDNKNLKLDEVNKEIEKLEQEINDQLNKN